MDEIKPAHVILVVTSVTLGQLLAWYLGWITF